MLSRSRKIVEGQLTDVVEFSEAKLNLLHPVSLYLSIMRILRGADNMQYSLETTMPPPAHEIWVARQRVGQSLKTPYAPADIA